jgi:hypothetical protein
MVGYPYIDLLGYLACAIGLVGSDYPSKHLGALDTHGGFGC